MSKLLLYCTNDKNYPVAPFYKNDRTEYRTYDDSKYGVDFDEKINGKIVAECDCNFIEEFTADYRKDIDQLMRIVKDSCIPLITLADYENKSGNCHCLYALHLSNLKAFDKLKELSEYFKDNFLQQLSDKDTRIHNAPQNMMYVYDKYGNRYILLSIHPYWLAKILNGEKTIEVRRKILNELKELVQKNKN